MNDRDTPATDNRQPTTVFLRIGIYIVLYILAARIAAPALLWLGGYLIGITLSQFLSALAANWIVLRIYGRLPLSVLGLKWNRASLTNLALGLAGGVGAASLVLLPPLAAHAAQLVPTADSRASWDVFLFTATAILAGAVGEELLFRGYGFQMLLRAWGPYTTIFTVAAVFGSLHLMNPHATWVGVVNTAGVGVLFGWAFLRSGDLWLPMGLHFGWNLTLPLFGVNLSGLTMKLTGHEMKWNVGSVWSGGEYGPEAGVLTTIVILVLALYLWKAPIRTQPSEVLPCAPGSLSSS
jgi:membrane protease YdiL (CAAX protease family)